MPPPILRVRHCRWMAARSGLLFDGVQYDMPAILIQLDDATYQALHQVAPSAKRLRAQFIRQAIKDAIRRREYERIREAYLRRPDSPTGGDDWSNCGEFNAGE